MGILGEAQEASVRAVLYTTGEKGPRIVIVENRPYPRWQKKRGYKRLPGGTLEAGETDLECLARELREELGIYDVRSRSNKPIDTHSYVSSRTKAEKVARVYIVGIDEDAADSLRPNREELLGCEVLGPKRAINALEYKTEKDALVQFCKLKKIFR